MCDTESNRISDADNGKTNPNSILNSATSDESVHRMQNQTELALNNSSKLNKNELLNGLNKSDAILIDSNAQKQTVNSDTDQMMQMTDDVKLTKLDQQKSHAVNGELNSQECLINKDHIIKEVTITGNNDNKVQTNSTEVVNKSIPINNTGNCLVLNEETNSNAKTIAVVTSKIPNEQQPSNTENTSLSSQQTNLKSTETTTDTPKRLHVSNLPFKYHHEHLRQLFSVSFIF